MRTWTKKKKKTQLTLATHIGIVLGGVCAVLVGVFGLAYFFAGEIYHYIDTYDPKALSDVDVIVCLAGGRGRITASGELWYQFWEKRDEKSKLPILYVSGMGPSSTWTGLQRLFSRSMRDIISPSDVILERESENTVRNAEVFSRFAKERNWKKALLVTSPYHMKRAVFIFNEVLKRDELTIAFETLSIRQDPFEMNQWRATAQGVRVTLEEYFKWIYYRFLWRF